MDICSLQMPIFGFHCTHIRPICRPSICICRSDHDPIRDYRHAAIILWWLPLDSQHVPSTYSEPRRATCTRCSGTRCCIRLCWFTRPSLIHGVRSKAMPSIATQTRRHHSKWTSRLNVGNKFPSGLQGRTVIKRLPTVQCSGLNTISKDGQAVINPSRWLPRQNCLCAGHLLDLQAFNLQRYMSKGVAASQICNFFARFVDHRPSAKALLQLGVVNGHKCPAKQRLLGLFLQRCSRLRPHIYSKVGWATFSRSRATIAKPNGYPTMVATFKLLSHLRSTGGEQLHN
mmetsp:Transcript_50982/g.119172  ORF Transcript_50982/g.119172 Transcript_50982/m.119172 type:complete len:286 (+) Transcript_50982:1496-2353(+)